MHAAGLAPMLSAFESMCDSTPVFSHPHSQPQLWAGRCIAEPLTIRAASKKSGDPGELTSCIVNDSTGAHRADILLAVHGGAPFRRSQPTY